MCRICASAKPVSTGRLGETMGVIGTYPLQRVPEHQAEGQIACASGPTRRHPHAGSFGRSRLGFSLEELGLIRPAIMHGDLVGGECSVIVNVRCVV